MTGISAILARLLKHYGLRDRILECSLRHHWKDIVGEGISAHSIPIRIQSQRLHLWVDSVPWVDQLNHLKPLLLKKINAHFTHCILTGMIIKTGQPPVIPPEPPQRVKDKDPKPLGRDLDPSPDLELLIQEYLKSVGDQKLKEVLHRVMIKSLTIGSGGPARQSRDPALL